MAFLEWLHGNAVISWIHESDSLLGYTLYLSFHTIGMVFLVGPTLIIAARVLGLAPDLAIKPLKAFRPVILIGLWITLITGSVLFATAAPDYVKNGVFIVKIISLVIALLCLRALLRELFDREGVDADPSPRAKALTVAMLLMWLIGVVAGRLTAYSGVVVFAATMAFLVFIALFAAGAYVYAIVVHRSGERRPVFPMASQPAPIKGGK